MNLVSRNELKNLQATVEKKNLKHCVKSVQIQFFSGPYFSVFSPNTGKYGPEKTPYLDAFLTVLISLYKSVIILSYRIPQLSLACDKFFPEWVHFSTE